MRKSLVLFFLIAIKLSAITVQLINDTMYNLEATIQNAHGEVLEVMTLSPQALTYWSDTYGEQGYSGPFPPPPDQHVYSTAPFKITWRCPSGDVFSVNSNMPAGATVQASQGTGNLSCRKSSSSGTASSGAPAS